MVMPTYPVPHLSPEGLAFVRARTGSDVAIDVDQLSAETATELLVMLEGEFELGGDPDHTQILCEFATLLARHRNANTSRSSPPG